MKLNQVLNTLLLCVSGISLAHAEALTQPDYDQQIQHYTQVIKNTKVILDDLNSKADGKTQSQAFCERLNAYQQIAQLSRSNPKLDFAPTMLRAAETYLDRQQKSLINSGMTADVFCAGKMKQ